MAGLTSRYGLQKLSRGDTLAQSGYKFSDRDRDVMDQLLYLGAEGHRHTGDAAVVEEPDTAASLTLSASGGSIPGGTRVFYKYTWVDDQGQESIASPEAYVDTPDPVQPPAAPSLSRSASGGTLNAGNYYYVLSAYVGSNTSETRATATNYITAQSGSTNTITLTLPNLPSGADGFNVYRRSPGQSQYHWLIDVDMTVATPPTQYVDDGSDQENCDRGLPATNTSNSSYSVIVTLPGATPAVPGDGYTWKIYRTYVNGNYENSFLHHVVETVSEGDDTTVAYHEDVGTSTFSGQPPTSSETASAPSQIELEDAAEVQGRLPVGLVAGFPATREFTLPGTVTTQTGSVAWLIAHPAIKIVSVTAHLGRGSAPASQDVIVDVNLGVEGATPTTQTYTTIFTTQANRPTVPVSRQVGDPAIPDVVDAMRGQTVTVDVDQAGSGATPTDADLVVTIEYVAIYDSAISADFTS